MPTDNLKKWTEDPNYKKPGYGKEIPQTKKFKSDLDAWLTGNVVEPMANAGYPNLGAGIATVPSTLAEFLLPENTAELAPGMAGVGKIARKGKFFDKKIDEFIKSKGKAASNFIRQALIKLDSELQNRNISPTEKWDIISAIRTLRGKLTELGQDNIKKEYTTDNIEKYVDNSIDDTLGFFKASKNQMGSGAKNTSDYTKLLDLNDAKRNIGSSREIAWNTLNKGNISSEPYLRPKGYAKQPKMVKPELPQSPIQTREQYDEMLRGKNPGQEYFSGMTDEFNNAQMKEDDFDLIKQLIDKSWKAK